MKYGLMVVGHDKIINIGDYIQGLASMQFLPSVDCFVEREKLSSYDGDYIKMIMNGWYMHNPDSWPPSNKIDPLYVAVHINNKIKEDFSQQEKLRPFLSANEVGCRDKETCEYLENLGVNAYFSGCMTLTLGQTYKSERRSDDVYIVDPAIPYCRTLKAILKYVPFSICHFNKILKIYRKKYAHSRLSKHTLLEWVNCSCFYSIYRELIDETLLLNAHYITQQHEFYSEKYSTHEERNDVAKGLLNKYASARLVITSRIHCALPCLGLETPVIYIYDDKQDSSSSCRLKGLVDLFNILHLSKDDKLQPDFGITKDHKLSVNFYPKNKDSWKPIADALIVKCKQFVNSNI